MHNVNKHILVALSCFHILFYYNSTVHSFSSPSPQNKSKPSHVVIIGGGWAGYTASEELTRNAGENLKITLIDASVSAG